MCGIVCCYENVKTAQLYPGKVTALLSANQSINQSINLFHFPETHLQGIYATWIWKSSKKYNTGYKQYNYCRKSIMYKGQMQGKVFVDKQVQFIQCSENCK